MAKKSKKSKAECEMKVKSKERRAVKEKKHPDQSLVRRETLHVPPTSHRSASRETEKTSSKAKRGGRVLRKEDMYPVNTSKDHDVTHTKKTKRRGRARSVEVRREPVRTIDSRHHYLKLKKPPPTVATTNYRGTHDSHSDYGPNKDLYEKYRYYRSIRDEWAGPQICSNTASRSSSSSNDHEYEIPVSFENSSHEMPSENAEKSLPMKGILKNSKTVEVEDLNTGGSFANLKYIDIQSPKQRDRLRETQEDMRNGPNVMTSSRGRQLNENLSWKNQFAYMHPACRRKADNSTTRDASSSEDKTEHRRTIYSNPTVHSRGRIRRPSIGVESDDSMDTVGVRRRNARSESTSGRRPKKHVTIDSSLPVSRENVGSPVMSSSISSIDHDESYLGNILKNKTGNRHLNLQKEDIRKENLELQEKKLSKKPVYDDVMIDKLAGREMGVKRHICFMNTGSKCPNCDDEDDLNRSTTCPRNDDFWIKHDSGTGLKGDSQSLMGEASEFEVKESAVVSALKQQFEEAAREHAARRNRTDDRDINI